MIDQNASTSSEASAEGEAEDFSDIDSERPPGSKDTEELSVEQIQELLKKSSTAT